MTEQEKQKQDVVFYCKFCKIAVKPEKTKTRYVYKCPTCKKDNVAFGSKKGVCDYFHIKEHQLVIEGEDKK